MADKSHILLLNGKNLNLLGNHEPDKYTYTMLTDIVADMSKLAGNLEAELNHFQSNMEYMLINGISQERGNIDFIVINPSVFTYTSVALRDVLLVVNIPFIEIHLSNVHAREPCRHNSYLSDVKVCIICNLGARRLSLCFTESYQTPVHIQLIRVWKPTHGYS